MARVPHASRSSSFFRGRLRRLLSLAAGLAAACVAQENPLAAQGVRHFGGHEESLYSVIYSLDGEQVVSGSFDRSIIVWDRATGKVVRKMTDHGGTVLALALSRDGRQLASGSLDRTARVWDMPIAKAVAELPPLAGEATAVAISPDGKTFVTGDSAKQVRLWNTENQQHLRDFGGSTEAVVAVAFSNDSSRVAAICKDGALRVWNRDDGRLLSESRAPSAEAMAFHPDNQQAAVAGSDGVVRFFGVNAQARRKFDGATQPLVSAFPSGDGNWIAAASRDGKVRIYETGEGKYQREVNHGAPISAMALSRDSQTILTGGEGGDVKLWRSGDGGLAGEAAAHAGKLFAATFLPNNSQILTSGQDGVVRLWQLPLPTKRESRPHNGGLFALAISPDGNLLVTASPDKTAKILRWGDLGEHKTLGGHEQEATAAAFSSDNGRVLTGGKDQRLRLFSAGDGNQAAVTEPHGASLSSVALHPSGGIAAGGGENGVVKLWKVPEPTLLGEINAQGNVVGLRFIQNGGQLVSASDRHVKVWKTDDRSAVRAIDAGAGITALSVSKDEQLAAVGGADHHVRVYKLGDGQGVHDLQGHGGPVTAVAFLPDGKHLASASADNTVRLWNLDTKVVVQQFPLPRTAKGLVAAADGKSLAVGLDEGQTIVLPIAVVRAWGGHHQGPVTGFAVHNNGTPFYTSSTDRTVRRWNIDQPNPDKQYDGLNGEAADVALSPDGNLVAATGGDRQVRVWRTNDGGEQAQWQLPNKTFSLAFAPDNRRLAATCEDKLVRILDVPTKLIQEQFADHEGVPLSVEFVGNGSRILIAGTDHSARLLPVTGLRAYPTHQGKATAIGLSNDGNQFFTVGEDRLAAVWNTGDGNQSRRFQVGPNGALRAVARSANQQLFATGGDDRWLRVGDYNSGQERTTIETPAPVVAVAVDAEGKTILVAGADGKVRNYAFFQTPQGQHKLELVQELKGHGAPAAAVALSPDLKLAYSAARDRTVKRWSLAKHGQRQALSHGGYVYGADFSPDGTKLVTACADKTVRFWNLADGANFATGNGHENTVYAVAWRPQGDAIASSSSDRTIRLWNPSGQPQKVLKEDVVDGIYSIAFHPQGEWLVGCGLAKTWQLWRYGQDKPERTVKGHPDYVYKIAFNAAGSRVATIGYGGHLMIWDVFSGDLKHQQKLEVSSAYSLAWAPGGDELAIATQDNRLWLVGVPPQAR